MHGFSLTSTSPHDNHFNFYNFSIPSLTKTPRFPSSESLGSVRVRTRVSYKAASNNDQNDAQPHVPKFDRRFVWGGWSRHRAIDPFAFVKPDWKRPSKTVKNHAKQAVKAEYTVKDRWQNLIRIQGDGYIGCEAVVDLKQRGKRNEEDRKPKMR